MSKSNAVSLTLSLPEYKGQCIGFFHSGGSPRIKGWWEYEDGSEGGELWVNAAVGEVDDFDGACNLPAYVIREIQSLGIKVPFKEY